MSITFETIQTVSARLYEQSVKKSPADTKAALRKAVETETNEIARQTLTWLLSSTNTAEQTNGLVCADAGIPVYFVKIGTRVQIDADVRKAIEQGYKELVETISPPLIQIVTDPLTLQRGYTGKDIPIVTFDLLYDADYIELICSPKGLGSGLWADLQIFSFPSIETIEKYILDCVMRAGSQPCPPIVIGVGIGGTFDYAAKLAKLALLRPIGKKNRDDTVAAMEKSLLNAVNKTGIGPMGLGGDTTALTVNIEYASGHGFVPVAVCFNCWPNRRMKARIYNDGKIEYLE